MGQLTEEVCFHSTASQAAACLCDAFHSSGTAPINNAASCAAAAGPALWVLSCLSPGASEICKVEIKESLNTNECAGAGLSSLPGDCQAVIMVLL
jgi:hypothetical protein